MSVSYEVLLDDGNTWKEHNRVCFGGLVYGVPEEKMPVAVSMLLDQRMSDTQAKVAYNIAHGLGLTHFLRQSFADIIHTRRVTMLAKTPGKVIVAAMSCFRMEYEYRRGDSFGCPKDALMFTDTVKSIVDEGISWEHAALVASCTTLCEDGRYRVWLRSAHTIFDIVYVTPNMIKALKDVWERVKKARVSYARRREFYGRSKMLLGSSYNKSSDDRLALFKLGESYTKEQVIKAIKENL